MTSEPTQPTDGMCLDFTYRCAACIQPVEVRGGLNAHQCPDPNALIIEGCGGSDDLTTRVERALADLDIINALEAP